jgi:SAM-dependent methyltransferase
MRPYIPEMLDIGGEPPEEVARSLADLRRMNRWLGGRKILADMLASQLRLAAIDSFTLLDVGSGSGDATLAVARRFPRSRVVLCDLKAAHLPRDGRPGVAADAGRLPFPAGAFDFVCASLLVHQLRDDDVVAALREFGRVARRAALISDLERHWLPRWFLRLAAPVFARSYITRHDIRASFLQAFRPAELRSLAREAGFARIDVRRRPPWFRLTMVAAHA